MNDLTSTGKKINAGQILIMIGLAFGFFVVIPMLHFSEYTVNGSNLEKRKRDAERSNDLVAIQDLMISVLQKEEIISQIPNEPTEICRSNVSNCNELLNLGKIINWDNMPYDKFTNHPISTRYTIHKYKLDNPTFGGLKKTSLYLRL